MVVMDKKLNKRSDSHHLGGPSGPVPTPACDVDQFVRQLALEPPWSSLRINVVLVSSRTPKPADRPSRRDPASSTEGRSQPQRTIAMTPHERGYPYLPPELINAIIDHLIIDKDVSSLRQCALTHRSMSPKAQQFLFSRIELGLPEINVANEGEPLLTPSMKLYDILKDAPHVSEYIHTLDLVLVQRTTERVVHDDGKLVARALPLLQHLRCLKLEVRSGRCRDLSYAVMDALASPTVTELHTRWIHIPMSIIGAFPNLRIFACDNMHWLLKGFTPIAPALAAPRVEILKISRGYNCVRHSHFTDILSSPPLYFSRLVDLDLSSYHPGFPDAMGILRTCKDTLQRFEIAAPSTAKAAPRATRHDLSILARLECLVIRRMYFHKDCFWTWILETISTAKSLHTLRIDFLMQDRAEEPDMLKVIRDGKQSWTQLDKVLGSSSRRFERVQVHMRSGYDMVCNCSDATELLRSYLALTNERSSLCINITNEPRVLFSE
ncbi:hypothetical protein BD626DRAFT_266889 [Schizophyllum amplum]|uniref:F-box domain-containing protein n=1 Tax=Schizophyllum amplum TaxID=97359 RepID=A0A550BUB9_9AGAR|nr:hypothetical protein BD626DRAFT_266889 [Auriculariopsis ampla]